MYSAPPSSAALEAEGLPSASAASSSSTPFGEGITIRHGLFRFTNPKEIIVRRYDDSAEAVHNDGFEQEESEGVSESNSSKRLKTETGSSLARSPSSASLSKNIEGTIISQDYLKTLDPKLAPYPFEKQAEWKRLTSLITSHTLNTVLGTDSNGDSRCDSLMSSLADEFEGTSYSLQQQAQKSQWGKERKINEIDEMDKVNTDENERKDWQEDVKKGRERCMRFANFDLKRSWRSGALGEEITRDSRDKSWVRSALLNKVDEKIRQKCMKQVG